MSQERQFLETLFQPTFRVLGRSLLPMEVGHWLLLSRLDKLLLPGSNPGGGDLALATYVCSRPHWQAATRVARPGLCVRASLAILTRHGAVFERGLATWRAYLKWNMDKPVYRECGGRSGGGRETVTLNAPFWLVYLRRAKASGLTEREALSQKVKAVLWEELAHQEECGSIVWCSEEEMSIQEFVRAKQAEAAAAVEPTGLEPATGGAHA